MKQTTEKKLELRTETLRNLQPDELQQVAGGKAADTTETQAAGAPVTTNSAECMITTTF